MKANRNNFAVIKEKTPSICIDEWKAAHPHWFAIVERDQEKDGYGWIRYRGSRPYPYSVEFLKEQTHFDEHLCCDPHNCYEIVPKKPRIPKNTKLSSDRMKGILKEMNK